jgi:FAD/FMN-containing dehydrogenase/Fe-S oxidoreductase
MLDFLQHKRQQLLHHLRQNMEGEVRFDDTARKLYSTDASIYQIQPLGVVLPRTMADLQAAVQIAMDMHVPIVPRGGGTSLSGQSIGAGLVIDCSKHLNRILEIDVEKRRVKVQPGVILDQLNRALAPHGLQFGPDVATASRANLGGMIGNNSAGSHSIVYGKTIDHVQRLGVLLSDGSRADFGPIDRDAWHIQEKGGFVGSLYRAVRQVVQGNGEEINRRFPKILRRVSGYNLDVFAAPGAQPVGLHQLVVGSEGTLAVIAEAELNLVVKPRAVGLLIPQFDSLAAAMDALEVCLDMQPSAIELLDHMLLELARNNLALRNTMAVVRGNPQALFMVEFSSDDPSEVANRIERLQGRLRGAQGLTALLPALDSQQRNPLWNLRNAAVPLLLGVPGDRKPVTFIEDTAVSPKLLPQFVARFREVLRRHGTDGAFYGHASVGCLHIRPVLNLKEPGDVVRMRRIAEDITDLVKEFGGSLSGEHGDGLARSEWNRKMFGDQVYQAFRTIKDAFDPHHLLNPGKIVEAPPMTDNLRYGMGYSPPNPGTIFDYSKQEGFTRAIELCNGAGVCRKLEGGTMCPSFRATHDEQDSTRARANALRLALGGAEPLKEIRSTWVQEVLDLCLMCKACKSECPSNVDMAKLKAEVLHLYYQDRLRPLGHFLLAHLPRLQQLGSLGSPLVNWLGKNRLVRWGLQKWAGIDRRRSLPPFYFRHLRRWFAGHRPLPPKEGQGKVLLLDDCFITFNEPHIGRAAVRVLEKAGYQVELAGLECCGRTLISKGFLTQARDLVQKQAPRLAARLRQGMPLLGLEPSCLLTLVDEWPELCPGSDTEFIARNAHLTEGWLAAQIKAGRCSLDLQERSETCLVHGHCHQKALVGLGGTAAALGFVPGLKVQVLDTGCCGMAGSFGYEKFDLSTQIANLDLVPALQSSPDALVVATGTSCRHQIKDLAHRKALHPLEILDQASTPSQEAQKQN